MGSFQKGQRIALANASGRGRAGSEKNE